MVLSKAELIASLKQEVRILVHLCGKVDRATLDYRPTPKQRSAIELLQYLVIMGPELIKAVKTGAFDPASWTAAEKAAKAGNFDQTVAALAAQAGDYELLLGAMSDADFREEIEMFGSKASRGFFIVNFVTVGSRGVPHAAVLLPQVVRPRGAGHDEPVGRDGPAGEVASGPYEGLSGNRPGIQREASVAGNASSSAARVLSDTRTPRSSSAETTRRALRSLVSRRAGTSLRRSSPR